MLMEALVSNFNNMEMKNVEMLESEIQQKPESEGQNHMENAVNQEKPSESPESEVNLDPVETSEETVVETDVNTEKQTDEVQGSDVNAEPVGTCQETVMEAGVNPEKQADLKAMPEVDQKSINTRQETVVETDVIPEKKIADPGVIYRCRRCRQMVATEEYVVTHEVGRGDGHCRTRKNSLVDEDDKKPKCSMCIFVEPMKWMKAVEEGYIAHKLYCMGCNALLGQFNWAGMQCSCGTWVIPAFQLTKSKLDECSM